MEEPSMIDDHRLSGFITYRCTFTAHTHAYHGSVFSQIDRPSTIPWIRFNVSQIDVSNVWESERGNRQ